MKKILITLGIVLAVALCIGGFSLAGEVISSFAFTFYSFLVSILPFLSLEQTILAKLVTILIVQIICGLGFYISHRTEVTIGKYVSGAVDAIATILLLIA